VRRTLATGTKPPEFGGAPIPGRNHHGVRHTVKQPTAHSNYFFRELLDSVAWIQAQWVAAANVDRVLIYRWINQGRRIRPDNEHDLINALVNRCRELGKTSL
jgi:hypothetical protein